MKQAVMRIADVVLPAKRWRRRRDDGSIDRLAESIRSLGLLNPISVTVENVLVAGLHRLEACRLLGWERIAVTVLDVSDVDRELAEIDENLIREELTVLERGEHFARRKELYEARFPDAAAGVRRAAAANAAQGRDVDEIISSTFASDTSAKTGVTERTVQHEVQIATSIPQDLRDELRDTPVADNKTALLDLARIKDEDEQRAVTGMIVAGEARNVQQARRRYAEEQRTSIKLEEDPDCRIVLGDCVHQVRELEARPACVIADPPYGIAVHNTRRGEQDYADGEDYAFTLLERLCPALVEKCLPDAHLYFFSGYTHAYRMKQLLSQFFEVQDNPIIWEKDNHTMCDFAKWYPSKHEYVWFAKQRGSERRLAACVPDVIDCKRSRESTHSAEKPTALLSKFIEQSTVPGELVLDPFCGSGSTGVACKALSRAFVGIESDTHWVEVARARVAA